MRNARLFFASDVGDEVTNIRLCEMPIITIKVAHNILIIMAYRRRNRLIKSPFSARVFIYLIFTKSGVDIITSEPTPTSSLLTSCRLQYQHDGGKSM
jgi:hypothetical protein